MLLSVWLSPVRASSLVDSRISQLEFQVRSLATQVNQFQSQRSNASNGSNGSNRSASTDIAPMPTDPSFAQQFDNLATLVIEMNQRLAALEQQVAATTP
ncbi:MAG: hypothetical protein WA885_12795 [Phormidesmis sp.]